MRSMRRFAKLMHSSRPVISGSAMNASLKTLAFVTLLLLFCTSADAKILKGKFPPPFKTGSNVTFDHRALIINGERQLFISGAIHYARSTPLMWPSLFRKAREGGINLVQSYVFWNSHEPYPRQYDFSGRLNLIKFIEQAAEAGLFVTLRIGPYIAGQVSQGGLPYWLRDIPGIEFRTDNEPFKAEMRRFMELITNMLKGARLMANQGGPIVLLQIENEYGLIQNHYGSAGDRYLQWMGNLTKELDLGVPWVMGRQPNAPPGILSSCNDFYCCGKDRSPELPALCTEGWTAWDHQWGCPWPRRAPEDAALALAWFFATGGTYGSIYMYHGGTNFERMASGPFIATSYDFDGPLDEYGVQREPKYSHLRAVSYAIWQCREALLLDGPSQELMLGPNALAYVYGAPGNSTGVAPGAICAAFLVNIDSENATQVQLFGKTYILPVWSISILPDCQTVAHCTAILEGQTTDMAMQPLLLSRGSFAEGQPTGQAKSEAAGGKAANWIQAGTAMLAELARLATRTGQIQDTEKAVSAGPPTEGRGAMEMLNGEEIVWSWQEEPMERSAETAVLFPTPLSQLPLTLDKSDYMWYKTIVNVTIGPGGEVGVPRNMQNLHELHRFESSPARSSGAGHIRQVVPGIDSADPTTRGGASGGISSGARLKEGVQARTYLEVYNGPDAFHVFVNGKLQGSAVHMPTAKVPVGLVGGANEIAILSVKMGLKCMPWEVLEDDVGGLLGDVLLSGLSAGAINLTSNTWEHQPWLLGEVRQLFNNPQAEAATWQADVAPAIERPLSWFRGEFSTPAGDSPLGFDLGSMGKGFLWVNGRGLGRFWPSLSAISSSCEPCVAGLHHPGMCDIGCGGPSQQFYHVPRDWLLPPPARNSLVLFEELGGDPCDITLSQFVADSVCRHVAAGGKEAPPGPPYGDGTFELYCSQGGSAAAVISTITFASYGTPAGACPDLTVGTCHANQTQKVVEQACLGKESCLLSISPATFGGDPCPGVTKSLAVRATCQLVGASRLSKTHPTKLHIFGKDLEGASHISPFNLEAGRPSKFAMWLRGSEPACGVRALPSFLGNITVPERLCPVPLV